MPETRFPLNVGDEFILHDRQVRGESGQFCGYILPGRYMIVRGLAPSWLIIRRLDHEAATEWHVGRAELLPILGEWSRYRKGESNA